MSDDETAIRKLVDSWMSASKCSDIKTLMDLMMDDVMFIVPGQAPFGKAEFKAASEAMRGMSIEGQAEICELHVFDQWAWMRNHIDIEFREPGKSPVKRRGFTLTIVHKGADGRWRVSRDANLVG